MASSVELTMIPATKGTRPTIASTTASIRSLNSCRSRVCPSPPDPPATMPWTPAPIMKSTSGFTRSRANFPSWSKGVVMGGKMPFKSFSATCVFSLSKASFKKDSPSRPQPGKTVRPQVFHMVEFRGLFSKARRSTSHQRRQGRPPALSSLGMSPEAVLDFGSGLRHEPGKHLVPFLRDAVGRGRDAYGGEYTAVHRANGRREAPRIRLVFPVVDGIAACADCREIIPQGLGIRQSLRSEVDQPTGDDALRLGLIDMCEDGFADPCAMRRCSFERGDGIDRIRHHGLSIDQNRPVAVENTQVNILAGRFLQPADDQKGRFVKIQFLDVNGSKLKEFDAKTVSPMPGDLFEIAR